ncbi:MAG: RNA polymerase sigma factor [Acidimicrobiales bacterium]
MTSKPGGSSSDQGRAPEWPPSFVDLYRAQYAPMVRLAFLLTGSASQAEEIVQDAFVRIRPHLDRVTGPVGYLRTSVVNGCRNQRRRAGLERRFAASETPEVTLDRVDELGDALGSLPYRQRAAIVLRYYLGMSEAEIAAELGCRPGTVKSLAHRGLAELRRVLER